MGINRLGSSRCSILDSDNESDREDRENKKFLQDFGLDWG